jgi:hypothetical protein
VKNNSYTNIVLMGVPHRFDLADTSCVNKEVDSFNNKLMKIVKPFKLATLLKFEQKREHFTRHCMHLNATGKASAVKLIVNLLTQSLPRKGRNQSVWDGKLNLMTISEVHEVKQDCFPSVTSTSNDVNNLNSSMCGPSMVNLVCSENHSNSKGPVTKAAVNKTSVE